MRGNQLASYSVLRSIERGLTCGTIRLRDPAGRAHDFAGRDPGPVAEMIIHDWRTFGVALTKSDIGLGEAYMRGWWDSPDLVALNTLIVANTDSFGHAAAGSRFFQILAAMKNRVLRRNSLTGSRKNIIAHYDIGNEFYKLWLDSSLTYSSALFAPGTTDLAGAQAAKYARILERTGSGQRSILEIGCGWGGFIEAAATQGAHVTGITISQEQYRIARSRAPEPSSVRIEDYRNTRGTFDAIVSIEMFEAVGERYWPQYFKVLSERLKPKGVAMVQTITIRDDLFANYRATSDFIRHHVFPGGMLPSLSRFREEAGKQGLGCRDVYSFGSDYARTLREWLARFDKAESEILKLGYDQSFLRGWRFYLTLCAAAFETGRTNVHQIELAH